MSGLLAFFLCLAGTRVESAAYFAVTVVGVPWRGCLAKCRREVARGAVAGPLGALPGCGVVVWSGAREPLIPVGASLSAVTGAVVGGSFPFLGVSADDGRAAVTLLLPAAEGAHPWHWVVSGCHGPGSVGGALVYVLCLLSWLGLGRHARARRRALGGGGACTFPPDPRPQS